MFPMFSLLSRGYGTYDGVAKSEPGPVADTPGHKVHCSMLI